jgi:signal transduction histidine kinase
METQEDIIRKLKKENLYYKQKLNELSGGVVSRDYKLAEINNEITQMRKGFALINSLNKFVCLEEVYDHFTEEINVQLQNDLSLVLLPVTNRQGYFKPAFIKGNPDINTSTISGQLIFIDLSMEEQKKSMLVNSKVITTAFIELLIKSFGIPFFIFTPILVNDQVIAYLFTGRKKETVLFAASRLLMQDVHTLEAIAGVIAALKNQQDQFDLVEKERTRISNDMHDEIGSGITHIALLSELIQTQQKDTAELKKDINIIGTSSRKLVQTMSEIIWALNPHNDTLENLLAYIREQSQQYFESMDVHFKINFPDTVADVKLSNVQRRNLYLVTREALNNAMKHSGAAAIQLKMEVVKSTCCFSVTDNGKGMCEIKSHSSNGIRNMKKRMKDIGGSIEWLPQERGTTVKYCLLV